MKKILYLLVVSIVGLYFVYGLSNVFLNFEGYKGADFLIVGIMLLLVALLEVFLIKKYKKLFGPEAKEANDKHKLAMEKMKFDKEKEKFNAESKVIGSKARQQLLGADMCIKTKHMAGLPIAEGAEIHLYRCKEKVIFERNQDTVELEINKVRDILIKTDVEIQKSYVSSAGGAVGGYVLFGPLGAMIGGRTKEKTSKSVEKYLIFAYEKNGETEYISLEVTNEPNAVLFNTNYYDLSSTVRRVTSL